MYRDIDLQVAEAIMRDRTRRATEFAPLSGQRSIAPESCE